MTAVIAGNAGGWLKATHLHISETPVETSGFFYWDAAHDIFLNHHLTLYS